MVRPALGSGMLGAGGVGRRVVAVAADAAEIDDGHGAKRHEDQRKLPTERKSRLLARGTIERT